MKWVVGLISGLVITVLTFVILLRLFGNVLVDITCLIISCGLDNWLLFPLIIALIIALIVGVAGFLLTSWYLGKKGAEEDSS